MISLLFNFGNFISLFYFILKIQDEGVKMSFHFKMVEEILVLKRPNDLLNSNCSDLFYFLYYRALSKLSIFFTTLKNIEKF